MKKFILYLIRWQLSTPILAIIVYLITDKIIATIVANLIGGMIFFWVDKFIFTSKKGYDKTRDANPQFRCYKYAVRKDV